MTIPTLQIIIPRRRGDMADKGFVYEDSLMTARALGFGLVDAVDAALVTFRWAGPGTGMAGPFMEVYDVVTRQ